MSSHLVEVPVFNIENRAYTFKRLGIKAVFHVIEVAKTAWKSGVIDLNLHLEHLRILAPNQEEAEKLKITPDLLLFFSIDHCLDDFMDLMTSYLLDVTDPEKKVAVGLESLTNEELFPAYSLITLGAFFIAHPDIAMFVSHFNEGKQLPFFQAIMGQADQMD